MEFNPQRLSAIRTSLGITKAQAAKMLNLSAMGYGRYEKGEREPSFQTVSYIAQVFGTSTDYLYGKTESSSTDSITIKKEDEPELFELITCLKKEDDISSRLLAYYQKLSEK